MTTSATHWQSYWSDFTIQPDEGGIWIKFGNKMCFMLKSDIQRFLLMSDDKTAYGQSYDVMGFRKDIHLDVGPGNTSKA